jgi:heme exporter protein D
MVFDMQFQFESLTDFFYMAGHGPYVWSCYLLGLICLTYLLVSPLIARKSFLADLNKRLKIEAYEKQQRN